MPTPTYRVRCLSDDGTCRMQKESLPKDSLEVALFWRNAHEYGFQHEVVVEEVR